MLRKIFLPTQNFDLRLTPSLSISKRPNLEKLISLELDHILDDFVFLQFGLFAQIRGELQRNQITPGPNVFRLVQMNT